MESASQEVLEMVKRFNPQLFIAGPAFNAGRYGVAAGTITKFVKDELNIPSLTGMYVENPGADMFKKDLYIIETADSAAGMRKALPKIAALAKKLANKEEIGSPAEEGYMQRGVRVNYFAKERGSKRAVDMLLKKIKGEDFVTEYPMPNFDRVDPQPAIKDLSKAKIALVTSGGIVPKGNPDRIESSSASKYGEYSIAGVNDLTEETYETAHGGFDPVYCNLDADRVLPVDVLRDLEREGAIGSLHEFFYSTTGNGTAVASAKKFAAEYAKKLVDKFDVRPNRIDYKAGSLSGGNQQKVIIAREITNDPDVLIAAQPTRGLDVGAIEYVHKYLVEQRNRGKAVLLISFELDEVMALSDRIAVIYEGKILKIMNRDETDEKKIGLLMAGGAEVEK